MFPQPDTGAELSAIGEGAGEGGEREGLSKIIAYFEGKCLQQRKKWFLYVLIK